MANGTVPLTANWNAGAYNITASWFLGKTQWTTLQGIPNLKTYSVDWSNLTNIPNLITYSVAWANITGIPNLTTYHIAYANLTALPYYATFSGFKSGTSTTNGIMEYNAVGKFLDFVVNGTDIFRIYNTGYFYFVGTGGNTGYIYLNSGANKYLSFVINGTELTRMYPGGQYLMSGTQLYLGGGAVNLYYGGVDNTMAMLKTDYEFWSPVGIRTKYMEGDYGATWSTISLPNGNNGMMILAYNTNAGATHYRQYDYFNYGWHYVEYT